MQIVARNDNDGYVDGWNAMTQRITERPSDAKRMLSRFAVNPPQDAFDHGALDAALVAFGH